VGENKHDIGPVLCFE